MAQPGEQPDQEAGGQAAQMFDLVGFTNSLIQDLEKLRAGTISPEDARARALLAKHVLRSVHYVVVAQKFLEGRALPIGSSAGKTP